MKVYLSGPITGLRPSAAEGWRDEVAQKFVDAGMEVADPLRGTEKLHNKRRKIIPKRYAKDQPALSDKAFVQRDIFDCRTADVIFVNLLEATEKSIGTICEIAFNMIFGNICVIVMKPSNVHNHPFVREGGVIFENLDDAVAYVISCVPEEKEAA